LKVRLLIFILASVRVSPVVSHVTIRFVPGMDKEACYVAVLTEVAMRTYPMVGRAAKDTLTDAPLVCSVLTSTEFVLPIIVLLEAFGLWQGPLTDCFLY
jgi:hypothetical protein